ncbi:MAG: 6-bladed beta-propeller, partial [Gemmatimonadales bacterium]
MRRDTTFVAISTFLLAACSGEVPEAGFQARDSAGVRILENAGSLGARLLPWELGEAPLADIGAGEGDPSHELYRVRDVLRLPDGRIAVQDGGSNEIRFFSSNGRHLGTVGGGGGGPGEYRSVAGLALAGSDSLLAFDDALGRITVLDLQGDFIDSFRLQATGDPIHPLRLYRLEGTTEDAGLLMLAAGYPADMKPNPVIHWDSVANLLYGMDST